MVKIGRSAQARLLLAQAETDEYQAEGVAQVVRDLVQVEERYEVDWLLDAANRITEPLYVEYAQRMICWLMVHYQNETKAWNAAHNALVGIEQLIQFGSRIGTYSCVADLVDMLLRLQSLRVMPAVDLMVQSLRLARMVGGQDSWDVIGAILPLLTRVGGRLAAERVWLEIERVDTMHGLSPRIERGSCLAVCV